MTGLIIICFVLFVVFLLPFDRRFIEGYIMKIGAKRAEPAAGDGFREAPMRGGSYTRQLCKMLKLEVVSFSRRKFIFGSRRVDVAIGRWNKEAQEFEIVTPWCQTWDGLEEEARRAVKAFRGMVDAKHRGTSNV